MVGTRREAGREEEMQRKIESLFSLTRLLLAQRASTRCLVLNLLSIKVFQILLFCRPVSLLWENIPLEINDLFIVIVQFCSVFLMLLGLD